MNTLNKPSETSFFNDYSSLRYLESEINKAVDLLIKVFKHGGKVMTCGNGGSASDSEHIVGELMKGFKLKRRLNEAEINRIKELYPDDASSFSEKLQGALPAISLVSQTSLCSAYINDVSADMVYAQQAYGYCKAGDVLIGLSTSGNSKNVINAIKTAKLKGGYAIGFTGKDGGEMRKYCDILLNVPAEETYRVQEYHLALYHYICAAVEGEIYGEQEI